MVANLGRNFREGKTRLLQGVVKRRLTAHAPFPFAPRVSRGVSFRLADRRVRSSRMV